MSGTVPLFPAMYLRAVGWDSFTVWTRVRYVYRNYAMSRDVTYLCTFQRVATWNRDKTLLVLSSVWTP
jgi:hypothetical protein